MEAHTVIDPRTVVVHLESAVVTDGAVVAAVWLDTEAGGEEGRRVGRYEGRR